ncbi:MAG: hypothetical protein Q9P44_00455 [Anaerolineae bacterium]|nr:hypothetical protein [Anaerolineae bacterium]
MEDTLRAYSAGDIAADTVTIDYSIGDSFSGETHLQLQGNGDYELWSTAISGRQRKEYSGSIEAAQVETLVQSMIENQIWQVSHVRDKPSEDDPLAIIRVTVNDNSSEVQLWISEIRSVLAFDTVQNEILTLIRAMSNDEILESGR